jgi:hypothetical protein
MLNRNTTFPISLLIIICTAALIVFEVLPMHFISFIPATIAAVINAFFSR